jgi:hypothetical protein
MLSELFLEEHWPFGIPRYFRHPMHTVLWQKWISTTSKRGTAALPIICDIWTYSTDFGSKIVMLAFKKWLQSFGWSFIKVKGMYEKNLILQNGENLRKVDMSYIQCRCFPNFFWKNTDHLEYLDISGIPCTQYYDRNEFQLLQNVKTLIMKYEKSNVFMFTKLEIRFIIPYPASPECTNPNLLSDKFIRSIQWGFSK